MAGHSKWANIKHRKGRQDAKRGKIFSVLIRELTVAAKLGGGVPDDNPRLRTAVDKALSANMTKDTIERAIQRGAGGLEGENLEEVILSNQEIMELFKSRCKKGDMKSPFFTFLVLLHYC